MDTDSYFVEMRKTPHKVIKEHAEEFHRSDYDKDCECYDVTNKKTVYDQFIPIVLRLRILRKEIR